MMKHAIMKHAIMKHAMMKHAIMKHAIELAIRSVETGGGPFGALVVLDGRIVGEGQNRVVPGADPTAHAEVQAIRDACRRLGTHDLSRAELFASCEPCPMCWGAVQWARLEAVCFAADREDAAAAGFDDRRFHAELARPPAERSPPARRLLAAEGRAPFAAWLANERRVPY